MEKKVNSKILTIDGDRLKKKEGSSKLTENLKEKEHIMWSSAAAQIWSSVSPSSLHISFLPSGSGDGDRCGGLAYSRSVATGLTNKTLKPLSLYKVRKRGSKRTNGWEEKVKKERGAMKSLRESFLRFYKRLLTGT